METNGSSYSSRLQNFHRSLVFLYFMGNNFSNAKRAICKRPSFFFFYPHMTKRKFAYKLQFAKQVLLWSDACNHCIILVENVWKCLISLHQTSIQIFSQKSMNFSSKISISNELMSLFSDTFNSSVSLFFPEHHRASRVNKPKTVLLGIDAGFKLLNWPT